MKIKNKNFCKVFFVMFILVVLFTVILYRSEKTQYINSVKTESAFNTQRFAYVSDSLLKEAEQIVAKLEIDPKINVYIHSPYANEIIPGIVEYTVSKNNSYVGLNRYITDIGVFSEINNRLCNTAGERTFDSKNDFELYNNFLNLDVNKISFEENNINIIKKSTVDNYTGGVYAKINSRRFISHLQTLVNENAAINMLDYNNNLLCGTAVRQEDLIVPEGDRRDAIVEMDDGYYGVSCIGSKYYDIKYISAIPLYDYSSGIVEINIKVAGLFLLMLVIAVAISKITVNLAFDPVKRILKLMDNPEIFSASEKRKDDDVSQRLINKITVLMNSENVLREQLNEKIDCLRAANLCLTTAQMNPHFLFNTLNIISWRILEEAGENSESLIIINDIAELLRYCMDTNTMVVSLEEDLYYTKKYIDILKRRYGDSVEFKLDFEDCVMGSNVPKMCLQPMIENSIVHGMKSDLIKLNICISGFCDDKKLILKVEDDGVGMSEQRLSEVRRILDENKMYDSTHLGVKNVKYRADICFNCKGNVEIDSKADEGTCVIITLPMQ